MTNIVNLFSVEPVQTAVSDDEAASRLLGIRNVLSGLELTAIQTQDRMIHALYTLTVANRCIRIVLDDFREAPNALQLIGQSEQLLGLIEFARTEVAALEPYLRSSSAGR